MRITEGDAARIDDPGSVDYRWLAGSALTMDVGMTNLLRWLDLPDHDVWAMGTLSVARRLGLSDVGDLRPGVLADLTLWDREPSGRLRAVTTWIAGRAVFDAAATREIAE